MQQQQQQQLQQQQQQQQEQLQLQVQQQMQEQQEELHRQEMHRQEVHRQEMQRRQEVHKPEEDDMHLRQHGFHHLSGHHHILNHDYMQDPDQDIMPHNNRQESHRDLLHPSSLLQDSHHAQTDDFYHEGDEFQTAYDPLRDHEPDTNHLVGDPINYHDSIREQQHHDVMVPTLALEHQQFKQEYQHSDIQHREHYDHDPHSHH